jgi:hypothetical protein
MTALASLAFSFIALGILAFVMFTFNKALDKANSAITNLSHLIQQHEEDFHFTGSKQDSRIADLGTAIANLEIRLKKRTVTPQTLRAQIRDANDKIYSLDLKLKDLRIHFDRHRTEYHAHTSPRIDEVRKNPRPDLKKKSLP